MEEKLKEKWKRRNNGYTQDQYDETILLKNSIHLQYNNDSSNIDEEDFEIEEHEIEYLLDGIPHACVYDAKLGMKKLVPLSHQGYKHPDKHHELKVKIK
jgi:hypothetical protein